MIRDFSSLSTPSVNGATFGKANIIITGLLLPNSEPLEFCVYLLFSDYTLFQRQTFPDLFLKVFFNLRYKLFFQNLTSLLILKVTGYKI